MKKSISVVASMALLGGLLLTGCGSSNSAGGSTSSSGGSTSSSGGSASSTDITIKTSSGTVAVDPTVGGTVITTRSSGDSASEGAAVVHAELNECNGVDRLGSQVACGPKEGVTYIFQTDFAALGLDDDNISTPDGGALLYDALTEYNGVKSVTPNEAGLGKGANRISEVFIPTNYIVLDERSEDDSVSEKYDAIRDYLANTFNMKCMFQEFDKNTNPDSTSSEPFFTDVKNEGKFVATYVMQFTRGVSIDTLNDEFSNGDKKRLEFLSLSFELDIKKNNAGSFDFSIPVGSAISVDMKKAGMDTGIHIDTTNVSLNNITHAAGLDDSDDAVSINMAKYFDKLIERAEGNVIANDVKSILVENATNPWPVKIYGTLHEITGENTFDRSFIRNPAKLDAKLFGLDLSGSYKNMFNADNDKAANAQMFTIVYPGGKYNKLD